jgi:glycosyltransferase involved in cell wall biosynthesis
MVTTIAMTMKAFLLPLVRHLRSTGWRVDGLASGLCEDAQLSSHFDCSFEAPWSRNPLELTAVVRGVRTARRLMLETHYDVVHVHTPVAAFATRFAARGRVRRAQGTQVIYSAHGFHFYGGQSVVKRSLFTAIERMAGRWTDWLVVTNEEDLAAARRLEIVPAERIVFIPGVGVDSEAFRPERVTAATLCEVERRLGMSSDDVLLLAICELNKNKRPVDVIRAFGASFGGDGRAHLAIIGEGPLRGQCEEAIEVLGLQGVAHLVGRVPDVRPYFVRSSATVLYSRREGLPVSALESLSMERPVIGSDIRGLRDLLRTGAGWLVDRDDSGQLERAMREAAAAPAASGQRSERGRIGRALVVDRFDVSHVLAAYDAVYAKAAACARANAACAE